MNARVVERRARHTPPADEQSTLRALCSELQSQGCTALVVAYSDTGDTDVRLMACCGGGPVVELLGPYNGVCRDGWWHAVRIDPEQRTVWRGPPRCFGHPRVTAFVTDLLREPPQELAGRYRAL